MNWSRKAWETGPCPWRRVEKQKARRDAENKRMDEAIRAIHEANLEAEYLSRLAKGGDK